MWLSRSLAGTVDVGGKRGIAERKVQAGMSQPTLPAVAGLCVALRHGPWGGQLFPLHCRHCPAGTPGCQASCSDVTNAVTALTAPGVARRWNPQSGSSPEAHVLSVKCYENIPAALNELS